MVRADGSLVQTPEHHLGYDGRPNQRAPLGNIARKRAGTSPIAEYSVITSLHNLRCQRLANIATTDKSNGYERLLGVIRRGELACENAANSLDDLRNVVLTAATSD